MLWDKKTEQIVNNESSEIIKMFNKDFDKFATKKYEDIYPLKMKMVLLLMINNQTQKQNHPLKKEVENQKVVK